MKWEITWENKGAWTTSSGIVDWKHPDNDFLGRLRTLLEADSYFLTTVAGFFGLTIDFVKPWIAAAIIITVDDSADMSFSFPLVKEKYNLTIRGPSKVMLVTVEAASETRASLANRSSAALHVSGGEQTGAV